LGLKNAQRRADTITSSSDIRVVLGIVDHNSAALLRWNLDGGNREQRRTVRQNAPVNCGRTQVTE
jgi:hypothetical protein